jgi:sugar lactone lactonase YvrE
MKRFFIITLFIVMSLSALLLGVSCSNQTPNTAFIAPASTIAANNPAWTSTPTPTPTPVPTNTPTPIPYSTPLSGFSGPYGLAIDSKNNVYVGDTGHNVIDQFVNGAQNTSWPSGKVKSNGLAYTSPKAIAVDSQDNLYVIGNGNAVSRYDTFGNYIGQYTNSVSGPQGVAVVSVNSIPTTLYVSNSTPNQIVSISLLPSGGLNAGFNTGILPLNYLPNGLAVNSAGTSIYVAGNDGNVHIYSSTGAVLATLPNFSAPYAIALDVNNNLYVSDTGNRQIEEFGFVSGNYSTSPVNIIGYGTLAKPEGIALDSSANVYVVDSINSELYQFP